MSYASNKTQKYLERFLSLRRSHLPLLHKCPESGIVQVINMALTIRSAYASEDVAIQAHNQPVSSSYNP